MPAEPRRTDAEIRGDIASERAQLVTALGDLRTGVESKKKVAGVVAGTLAAAMTAATVATIVRRLRR